MPKFKEPTRNPELAFEYRDVKIKNVEMLVKD